ncbi:MAG TPA: hypothetical protein VN900_04745 [Stellaceae bacterium]|jgi:hypothetical protein|nr:hypothetical protein [Stellaceae bacterium]
MARRYAAVLALAMIGIGGGALAQTAGNETPQQNVRSSQQYQQLTCSNKAFRATRIAKECGPLQGSQFYDSCVASFDCDKQPSGANWRQAPPSETIK